jgi:hypothetical protein
MRPDIVTVGLNTIRPVWLRAEVDGRVVSARLLPSGEALQLDASSEVVIRAGDAGAVLVAVNGGTPTPFGRDGAVLTRRFETESRRASASRDATSPPPSPAVPTSQAVPAVIAHAVPTMAASAPTAAVPDSPPAVQPLDVASPATPPSEPQPAPPLDPATGTDDETTVLRGHSTYFEALGRGDINQAAGLLAGGFIASGDLAADEAGIPYPIVIRNASVEVSGVGAVVSGTAVQRLPAADGQPSREQSLLFSELWIKRDGEWRLVNVRFMTPPGSR